MEDRSPGTVHPDETQVHSGRWAARLERDGSSEGSFTKLEGRLPVDFEGRAVSLQGYLRTEDVSEHAGCGCAWMGAAGSSRSTT